MDGVDMLLGMLVVLGAPAAVFLATIRWIAGGAPVSLTALYRYPDPQPRPDGSQDEPTRWDLDAVATRSPRQQPDDPNPRASDGLGVRRVAVRLGRRSSTGAEQVG